MKLVRTAGFTLIEILLVMSVIGFLAAATGVVVGPVLDIWSLDTPRNEATESASFALDRMVYEMAQIKDPTSLLVANSGRIRFTDVSDTIVDYQLSGSNLMRNSDILARGVQSLTFTYYNMAGATVASPQLSPAETDLWRVKIHLTVTRQGQSMTIESQVHPRNLPRG